MKKILTHLTGIVFLITILIAAGCNQGKKENAEADQEVTLTDIEFALEILEGDSTKVSVFLKDTLIGCKKHLIMHNVKHTGEKSKKVIDSLITYVYPGYTVFWSKTNDSEIKKVHQVRVVDSLPWNLIDSCLVGAEIEKEGRSLIKLVIPSTADTGTVKYEIIFEDKDKIFWCIDPYLEIPPP